MIVYSDAPRAWWLTRGMARVVGVSLPQAVVDGWLSRQELSGLVARCDTCAQSCRCEAWLAASGPAVAMPDFCPNKAAIEALSLQN